MAKRKTTTKEKIIRSGIDIPFFALVMVLLSFGLVMVFSASFPWGYYQYGDSFLFIKRQLIAAILGIVAMGFIITLDYHWLKVASVPFMGFTLLLLIAVLFIGTTVNDATRWIYIGPVNFQPSEFAKLAVIILFAHLISQNDKHMGKFTTGILPYMAILGVIALLLKMEPHYSALILICFVGMVMIFVGGAPLGWFIGMGAAGAAGIFAILMFTDYAKGRITTWLNPASDPRGKGYQILQSLYAIGSGGLMGVGLGQSRQKFLYIPEPHNDFIFAIICEELGFIGGFFVIILFSLLIWRGFVIAFRAPDKFGTLLVVGIITLIATQFMLNIAVVTNAMPTTGVALPFFSYGGTALMILLAEMGIVLNVSRYTVKKSS